MLRSDYRPLCAVRLPYAGRQRYMHSFDLAAPRMAEGYEDYLDAVVALCKAAGATQGMAHMTVDEKVIEPGTSQRRPKPHVDGCFIPRAMSWGHGGGTWSHENNPPPAPSPGGSWGHGGGGWNHYCNDIGRGPVARMPVIVAASAPGCRAWRGLFDGEPKNDGDLSHLTLGEGEVLPANVGYLLSADCVHESMILDRPTQRTFLRIALPVTFNGFV